MKQKEIEAIRLLVGSHPIPLKMRDTGIKHDVWATLCQQDIAEIKTSDDGMQTRLVSLQPWALSTAQNLLKGENT